jgi:sulfatase maturation enzyme AslB (radical SAM superfamily)
VSYVVSLDGLEDVHDIIRGRGAFRKTYDGIKSIVALKRKRSALKRIQLGVEVTMVEKNIDHLSDFATFINSLDLSWVVFNMQWYLDEEAGRTYEEYLVEHWFEKNRITPPSLWSWRGHDRPIGRQERMKLAILVALLQEKKWNIPVVFPAALETGGGGRFLRSTRPPFSCQALLPCTLVSY